MGTGSSQVSLRAPPALLEYKPLPETLCWCFWKPGGFGSPEFFWKTKFRLRTEAKLLLESCIGPIKPRWLVSPPSNPSRAPQRTLRALNLLLGDDSHPRVTDIKTHRDFQTQTTASQPKSLPPQISMHSLDPLLFSCIVLILFCGSSSPQTTSP